MAVEAVSSISDASQRIAAQQQQAHQYSLAVSDRLRDSRVDEAKASTAALEQRTRSRTQAADEAQQRKRPDSSSNMVDVLA